MVLPGTRPRLALGIAVAALRVPIANLRRKLGSGSSDYIRTDPGVGYRFAA